MADNWVWISVFFLELIAGVVMTAIVALLMIFRLPELKQVRLCFLPSFFSSVLRFSGHAKAGACFDTPDLGD